MFKTFWGAVMALLLLSCGVAVAQNYVVGAAGSNAYENVSTVVVASAKTKAQAEQLALKACARKEYFDGCMVIEKFSTSRACVSAATILLPSGQWAWAVRPTPAELVSVYPAIARLNDPLVLCAQDAPTVLVQETRPRPVPTGPTGLYLVAAQGFLPDAHLLVLASGVSQPDAESSALVACATKKATNCTLLKYRTTNEGCLFGVAGLFSPGDYARMVVETTEAKALASFPDKTLMTPGVMKICANDPAPQTLLRVQENAVKALSAEPKGGTPVILLARGDNGKISWAVPMAGVDTQDLRKRLTLACEAKGRELQPTSKRAISCAIEQSFPKGCIIGVAALDTQKNAFSSSIVYSDEELKDYCSGDRFKCLQGSVVKACLP